MQTSGLGLVEIADSECLCTELYLDSGGVRTIGIGSTVSEVHDIGSFPWGTTWTIDQCVNVYANSMAKYENAVNRGLTIAVKQHQFDALVSFIYNVGVGGTKSTLFKRINAGMTGDNIKNAFLMWVNDNGKKVQGLVNRRLREWGVYSTGEYPANGCVNHCPVDKKTHKPIYRLGKRINIEEYFK